MLMLVVRLSMCWDSAWKRLPDVVEGKDEVAALMDALKTQNDKFFKGLTRSAPQLVESIKEITYCWVHKWSKLSEMSYQNWSSFEGLNFRR
ncbi:hypothetical protein HanRHA438_Chr12g0568911 [Helianthus annuus]|uniref:Uncharacterized protein n=1 Tax=Helianthus annuus TaxID=4232 RepID=A0A9K3HJ65_HELAN|nr:hypothetical protein HanXRQr2_Chr12g0557541 [Helianthus annuus]KAJ0490570.1 hypothetical protein HanHA300_Chr12g0456991 [Helianthus annuus]KAJ0506489.1 hypothetical protein HanHA89_Chr12g0482571 [Helianthus annuus]KAJ0676167.1 hypothetical protein HanLR1_Chr12g0459581 [Helianthus annuus]KAJ0679397.1 hypothetical protein HanOQP8_Chr12g0458951 [Helianthus annuus]